MIGFVYVIASLLVDLTFLLAIGSLLGMTTPISAIKSLFVSPLYSVGPSLLIFTGVIILFPKKRRGGLCLITGTILVAALGLWTIPRIGWQPAAWLILEPLVVSLPAAYLLLLITKKIWISGIVGSLLSAPFCVAGSLYLMY